MVMRCTCCGLWTIEAVRYDLAARKHTGPLLVLTYGKQLIGEWPTVPQLRAGLKLALGPPLSNFEEIPR